MMENRKEKFQRSIHKYLFRQDTADRGSIGVLQEKTLHTIVKDFYAPAEEDKEIPVNGYVADICFHDRIIEIQNGNFGRLREKLTAFLPRYHVTVVLPIPYHKWTVWIDKDTGEVSKRNKSPQTGNIYPAFRELYRIRPFLTHPNLKIIFLLLDMEEYRFLDGWSRDRKRGSHRYDRIPLEYVKEIPLESPADYAKLLSNDLPTPFTTKDFTRLQKGSKRYVSYGISVLTTVGAIRQTGKRGNAYLYEKIENSHDCLVQEEGNVYDMFHALHVSARREDLKPYQKEQEEREMKEIIDGAGSGVTNRFLNYVTIDTQSDENSGTSPSTKKQHKLAKLLVKELKTLGVDDLFYDEEHCYVYAKIRSNLKDKKKHPAIGFIAHMDTSPDCSDTNVKPRIVEQYDGKDIALSTDGTILLSPKDFPELNHHKKEDLIVTDGTTLLGADDKAGISEIMTMVSFLKEHPEFPHGNVCIAFTPDEEIGEGTAHFDLDRFGADYAFTVDGGKLGELEYECFNAAEAELIIHGRSVHPGSAKGQMINATLIAYEFQSMLPVFENPMYTEGREGFYHLHLMKGTCEMAVCYYIIRDHDKKKFKEKKENFQRIADYLNKKYGKGTIECKVEDSYYNMVEKIKPHMHLVENARKAMKEVGVTPIENPIRGGTDGAALSFKGLPCPNLCTGGYNYHSRFEYASVQEMEKTVEILLHLIYGYSNFEEKKK